MPTSASVGFQISTYIQHKHGYHFLHTHTVTTDASLVIACEQNDTWCTYTQSLGMCRMVFFNFGLVSVLVQFKKKLRFGSE